MPKSMATTNLVTDVILKKYDEHLPLYRQSKILERDDTTIPDNTLSSWVMRDAECLSPLGDILWQQINKTRHLQADETTAKILEHNKKGYMWLYLSWHDFSSIQDSRITIIIQSSFYEIDTVICIHFKPTLTTMRKNYRVTAYSKRTEPHHLNLYFLMRLQRPINGCTLVIN